MEEGRPVSKVDYQTVSVDYFRTLVVPLLSGRGFNDADSITNPNQVCIVNQLMADHYWPQQDPIGHRVSNDSGRTWMTIVGVVKNIHQYGLDHDAVYTVYMPSDQHPLFESNLLLRSKSDPFIMARQAVAQIHQIDSEQPVTKIRTLEQIRTDLVAAPRVSAVLLGMFALLALCITIIGIVGMLTLVVARRSREIGIRMALGARRSNILRLIVTQGLTPVLFGLGVGAVAALILTRLISSLLFQLKPTDPLEYIATALVLLVSAFLACVVPARRATRIDPMIALRDS
jgi:predicted permease